MTTNPTPEHKARRLAESVHIGAGCSCAVNSPTYICLAHEAIEHAITAYANQRVEQAWREGVEQAAQKAEQQWALMSSFGSTETDHYTRACHEASAAIRALLNQPGEKS